MIDNRTVLHTSLTAILETIGRQPLTDLLFTPIAPEELDWYLAQLSDVAAPAYLPFADSNSQVLALHLHPARPIEQSPVVYLDPDTQRIQFVCADLTRLPTGLWLWMARYFKDRPGDLRQATAALAANIPDARPAPDAFWEILAHSPQYEPAWWDARCSLATRSAWELGDVGHPFVGLPEVEWDAQPADVLRILEPFVRAHPQPELLDLIIAAHIKAGSVPDSNDVLTILAAEAWLGGEIVLNGRWRRSAKGLCVWDAALRYLPEPEKILADTPFEVLADNPLTYSGEDPEGPLTLARIGEICHARGDYRIALNQFRNAITLGTVALGEYPRELARRSAEVCDAIQPDSLAAALARYMGEVDRNNL